ncbi:Slp family lipoprotein [Acidithiobacillus caldus]
MHSRSRYVGVLLAASLAMALGACSVLTPVAGTYPAVTPRQAQSGVAEGEILRWGGTIIGGNRSAGETCLTVLSHPLNALGKPQIGGDTSDSGRFLACTRRRVDLAHYHAGREITVIGDFRGIHIRAIGGHPYRYPILQISTLYLWPKRERGAMDHTFIQNGCSPLFTSIGCSSPQ